MEIGWTVCWFSYFLFFTSCVVPLRSCQTWKEGKITFRRFSITRHQWGIIWNYLESRLTEYFWKILYVRSLWRLSRRYLLVICMVGALVIQLEIICAFREKISLRPQKCMRSKNFCFSVCPFILINIA